MTEEQEHYTAEKAVRRAFKPKEQEKKKYSVIDGINYTIANTKDIVTLRDGKKVGMSSGAKEVLEK